MNLKFLEGGITQFRTCIFILFVCGLLVYGAAAQAVYIDNGDGTVTDNGTGLMWQQATAQGITSGAYTWEQALDYCENLILNNDRLWTSGTANASGAKYDDWRLPTAKELASLVDTTRYNPAINTLYFPVTVASEYWSSTTGANDFSYAWLVDFLYGHVRYHGKAYGLYVRAVRSGQYGPFDNLTLWPVPDTGQLLCYDNDTRIFCPSSGQPFYGQDASYSINTLAYSKLDVGGAALPDNATYWAMVRDEVTGLVWEEKHAWDNVTNYADPNDADNSYTWYDNNFATNGGNAGTPGDGTDTMDFIRILNAAHYGGGADWRMPTVKELQSIRDYSIAYPGPTINTTYFPNTVASGYWSSTTGANGSGSAWVVNFYGGRIDYGSKASTFYVRAVRSGQYSSSSSTSSSISSSSTTTTTQPTTTTTQPTTTTTQPTTTTTTTTSIKPCAVQLFPASISKLVSLILPINFFVISGEKGVAFTKDTVVAWDTEGIKTINTFVLFKFLIVQVLIKSQFLEATELYTVKVGDCFGTLKLRAF